MFLETWAEATITTLGFFWMALWAFCLGYLISSLIQVFLTRQRMRDIMGEGGASSVGLGTFFGFISSSCSFAALSTTRALFQKGAGLVPSLAFLLASTNLVIELGIVIFIFLPWQFVVGEYIGGLILILVMWAVVRLTLPSSLEKAAREHARKAVSGHDSSSETEHNHDHDHEDHKGEHDKHGIAEHGRLQKVGKRYLMEWSMVWKDVVFGFTVAGIIAAFVPPVFFETLFIGSGGEETHWWQTLLQTLIGPVAAFFTFIGSMGNIPLAGVLFASGVRFAGVMAFIFSDLVVFPVLRISAQYFGWRMAAYILAVFLACLIIASLILHYGFAAMDLLPQPSQAPQSTIDPSQRFAVDYTLFLNIGFLAASAVCFWLSRRGGSHEHGHHHHRSSDASWMQNMLRVLAFCSLAWLGVGLGLWAVGFA